MSDKTKPDASDISLRMIDIWRSILDHDEFGPNDNFFEVGGHSLVVTELVDVIEKEFGVCIPVEAVFDHPTIVNLCAFIVTKV